MAIILKSERSETYLELLGELKTSIVKVGDFALRLYKQGKKDGLSKELIRADIESALQGVITDRQLRNILPLELKHSKFANKSGEAEMIAAFQQSQTKLPNGCRLIQGDCTDLELILAHLEANSIDLIFTDPPYNQESIPLFAGLGELAMRVLKPSGSLITYFGQGNLPEVLELLQNSGLRYNWICYVKHGGNGNGNQNLFVHANHVIVRGKPLLWMYKGDKLAFSESYISDFIESEPPDKTSHEWAQSTVEAGHFIEKLTSPNSIVLDPFMGSGTTGIASLQLDRQFIGIDNDPVSFAKTRARMNDFISMEKIDNFISCE